MTISAAETSITGVVTYTTRRYPQLLHVKLETAGGLWGYGETFHNARAVEAAIHSVVAPVVLGQDALNAVAIRRLIGSRFNGGQPPPGVMTIDSSALSAVDIALWDLRGKLLGVPVCDLLGGRSREAVRVYNTCAGPGEGMPARGGPGAAQAVRGEPWGLGGEGGQYDDYRSMWERPAELASELLDEGIGAMKLYTFRPAALKTLGTYISGAEMARAIEPLERIRESVGGDMDLMMDLVFDWTLAPAQRIVRALDEFDLLWIEDPLRWGARRSHGVLQRQTKTPIAAFDYAVGLESYLDLLRGEGVSIARIDPQWAGGISEAATIARLADAVGIGVVFHDCAGPLSFLASVHLAIHCPNTVLQESVRGYWRAVYPAIVTHTPVFDNGRAAPPSDAGLGAELSDEYLALPDLRVMRSDGRDAGVVTEVRA